MMRRAPILVASTLCAVLVAGAAHAFDLTKWTLDGGGGRSSGGAFVVEGTVGQPDAQTSAGGAFVLRGGYWGAGETATGVEEPGGGIPIPRVAHLGAGAPNPFNPRVSFRFELPDARDTAIDVYDAAGRHVRRLVRGTRTPGAHDITWDGTDDDGRAVASGVFFVHMRAGNFAARQKVTLVK